MGVVEPTVVVVAVMVAVMVAVVVAGSDGGNCGGRQCWQFETQQLHQLSAV